MLKPPCSRAQDASQPSPSSRLPSSHSSSADRSPSPHAEEQFCRETPPPPPIGLTLPNLQRSPQTRYSNSGRGGGVVVVGAVVELLVGAMEVLLDVRSQSAQLKRQARDQLSPKVKGTMSSRSRLPSALALSIPSALCQGYHQLSFPFPQGRPVIL